MQKSVNADNTGASYNSFLISVDGAKGVTGLKKGTLIVLSAVIPMTCGGSNAINFSNQKSEAFYDIYLEHNSAIKYNLLDVSPNVSSKEIDVVIEGGAMNNNDFLTTRDYDSLKAYFDEKFSHMDTKIEAAKTELKLDFKTFSEEQKKYGDEQKKAAVNQKWMIAGIIITALIGLIGIFVK